MNRSDNRSSSDTGYLLVVGILLVLILASMGILWMRQRQQTRQWRQRAAELRQKLDERTMMLQQLAEFESQAVEAVQRADLPARDATVDGESRTVLLLSARRGEKLGLRPGDLVQVTAPVPDTGPATRPNDVATQPAPENLRSGPRVSE